jgi:hypothetical protein
MPQWGSRGGRKRGRANLQVNDTVRVRRDPPMEWVRAGLIGRIVDIAPGPDEKYEVEFRDDTGTLMAEVALTAEQLELLSPQPRWAKS